MKNEGPFPKRIVRGGHEWFFVRVARNKADVKEVGTYERHYHDHIITTLKMRNGPYGVYSRPNRRRK